MAEIKWNDIKCTSPEEIPKDTDLLVTIEDPDGNHKVVISKYFLHKPFPSAEGYYRWILPKKYEFDGYKVIAWAYMVQPFVNDSDDVNFNINVTMNKRWVPYFCSMLSTMEHNGNIGHSENISFYSDGDGDFRPKFKFDINFEKIEYVYTKLPEWGNIFDAG